MLLLSRESYVLECQLSRHFCNKVERNIKKKTGELFVWERLCKFFGNLLTPLPLFLEEFGPRILQEKEVHLTIKVKKLQTAPSKFRFFYQKIPCSI